MNINQKRQNAAKRGQFTKKYNLVLAECKQRWNNHSGIPQYQMLNIARVICHNYDLPYQTFINRLVRDGEAVL